MFTQKSIKWIIALTLLTVLVLGMSGVALASGPDDVVRNATEFISYLDSLRAMGQAEAKIVQARYVRERAVFDYSSYLVSLRDQAATMTRTTAPNRPTIGDAASYTTHLEQLRAMGSATPADANAFTTHLDQLRQKGQDTAQVTSPQATLP